MTLYFQITKNDIIPFSRSNNKKWHTTSKIIQKMGEMECHFLKVGYLYFQIALIHSSNI